MRSQRIELVDGIAASDLTAAMDGASFLVGICHVLKTAIAVAGVEEE